jgi:NADH-quinone oxidoreductase subunit N
MSTASKSAAFVALITIVARTLPAHIADWRLVIEIIAIISMVLGNVVAIVQDN